jgi:hypothetical protein
MPFCGGELEGLLDFGEVDAWTEGLESGSLS